MVYDCLFPHTIGGAERWMSRLAQRLAADGHEVSYLTLRQWPRGADPGLPGVRVIAVGPAMALYTASGRRRILPPLVFGLGVAVHLLRRGRRYDAVHTVSFPYFSLLAAGAIAPLGRYRLIVDWFEVWTLSYWSAYLGRFGGRVGWAVQRLCARIPQQAFCFSQLHARRLAAEGLRGTVVVHRGLYDRGEVPAARAAEPRAEPRAATRAAEPRAAEPLVVFAGRFIPEKRAGALVPAIALARRQCPRLRAALYGDGPEREHVAAAIAAAGLTEVVSLPGFVAGEEVQDAIARALCLALPSSREGYGLVVVEAASHGTPSVVVAGEDNAAVAAAWYVESAFKEPILSLLLIGEILVLAGVGVDWRERPRAIFVPLAVLVAGVLYDYSYPGLALVVAIGVCWLVATALIEGWWRRPSALPAAVRAVWPALGVGLVVLVALVAPDIERIRSFYLASGGTSVGFGRTGALALGNLAGPLQPVEALSIWTWGDFRFAPPNQIDAGVLSGLALAVLVLGLVAALERRRVALPAAVLGLALVYLYARSDQGPYVLAKAMAISAPIIALVSGAMLVGRLSEVRWPSWSGVALG
jgi:glycosyltransferase involved in cell wall biosynthesis